MAAVVAADRYLAEDAAAPVAGHAEPRPAVADVGRARGAAALRHDAAPDTVRLTRRFEAVLGPAVERLHPRTVDPPSHPRRPKRRLTWLFLRPGRLDRDPGV